MSQTAHKAMMIFAALLAAACLSAGPLTAPAERPGQAGNTQQAEEANTPMISLEDMLTAQSLLMEGRDMADARALIMMSTSHGITSNWVADSRDGQMFQAYGNLEGWLFFPERIPSRGTLETADWQALVDLLSRYQVNQWKADYGTPGEDLSQGTGWTLILLFEDGTVERRQGVGTSDAFPENFHALERELAALFERALGPIPKK